MSDIDDMRITARFGDVERMVSEHEGRLCSGDKCLETLTTQQNDLYQKLVGDLNTKGMITEFREMCNKINIIIQERRETQKKKTDWLRWVERSAIAGLYWFIYEIFSKKVG